MLVLSVNIQAFNAESPKLYNSYFTACACMCIVFLLEQWKSCTKLTELFLFYLYLCVHPTNALNLQVTNE